MIELEILKGIVSNKDKFNKIETILETKYFSNPVFSAIYWAISEYYKKFGSFPEKDDLLLFLRTNFELYSSFVIPEITKEELLTRAEKICDLIYEAKVDFKTLIETLKIFVAQKFTLIQLDKLKEGFDLIGIKSFYEKGIESLSKLEKIEKEQWIKASQLIDNIMNDLILNRRPIFSWGLTSLDMICGFGIAPREFGIIVAPPGKGKTTFLSNMALQNVLMSNGKVVYVTLEMSSVDILSKILSILAKVPFQQFIQNRKENLKEVDNEILKVIGERLIILEYSPHTRFSVIATDIKNLREEQNEYDILILIDYMNLIQAHRKIDEVWLNLEKVSEGLNLLCNELDICLISAMQGRQVHKINSYDCLYGSKVGVAKEAWFILALFNYWEYLSMGKKVDEEIVKIGKNIGLISILKNRLSGEQLVIPYRFNALTGEIQDLVSVEIDDENSLERLREELIMITNGILRKIWKPGELEEKKTDFPDFSGEIDEDKLPF